MVDVPPYTKTFIIVVVVVVFYCTHNTCMQFVNLFLRSQYLKLYKLTNLKKFCTIGVAFVSETAEEGIYKTD